MVMPKITLQGADRRLRDAIGDEEKRPIIIIDKIDPKSHGIGACNHFKTRTPKKAINKEVVTDKNVLNHFIKSLSHNQG